MKGQPVPESHPKPFIQKTFDRVVWILFGLLALGQVLDAIANAGAFFRWPTNAVVTVVFVFIWGALEATLRLRGLRWKFDRTLLKVQGLGAKTHLAVLGGIILVWIPSVWPSEKDKPFAAEVQAILTTENREESGGLWLTRQDYVAPVNFAVLVRLTNGTSSPIGIANVRLEMKDAITGQWVPLWAMDQVSKVFCCVALPSQLSEIHEIKLENDGLLNTLRKGAIPAQSQVMNWILYEFPKGLSVKQGSPSRLSFNDYSGKMYLVEHNGEYKFPPAGSPPGMYSANGKPLNGDIKRELDALVQKAISSPPLSLLNFRRSHFQDEMKE